MSDKPICGVMNPGERKSGGDTPFSVGEIVDEETEKLLEAVNEEGNFGKRKQEALKALVRIYSSSSRIIPPYRCGSHLDVMGDSVC
jgi:hypothetical protein